MTEDTISDERWLAVVGYEDRYEVSDRGRVRSIDRRTYSSRWGGPRVFHGRLRSVNRNNKGYAVVDLYLRNCRRTHLVSRLVLEAFVGPPPAGMECCHDDGDHENNWLTNLRWDSHSNNELDKLRHGTHYLGSRTDCAYGHRLAPPNLVRRRSLSHLRSRSCLACSRAKANQQYAIRMGRPFDFASAADRHYHAIMDI